MTLKLSRYYTMNSWNRETAPAYNLKIYNVIPAEFRNKVYEIINFDEYWLDVKMLISEFEKRTDFEYTAGFNGRSGGYLVLYGLKKQYTDVGIEYIVSYASIDVKDVPKPVLREFRILAENIVNLAIEYAKNYEIAEETIWLPRIVKVLKPINNAV